MGKVAAIILAAGTGSRMGSRQIPKQFLKIEGVPILAHTLKRFECSPLINQIVLVARREDLALCEQLIRESGTKKTDTIVEGGQKRQDSGLNGLLHVQRQTEVVLIHDAVRMFVTEKIIAELIHAARKYGASVTAVPVKDTIKTAVIQQEHVSEKADSCEEGPFVHETLERKHLWQIQTPQAFQFELILSIHQKAQKLGIYGTDDAMLTEYFGYPVKIVYGSYRNIKVTTPDDLLIAQAFLQDEKRHAAGRDRI